MSYNDAKPEALARKRVPKPEALGTRIFDLLTVHTGQKHGRISFSRQ